MIKYLKIGEIYIKLTYQYDDFFSDKIDAYVIEKSNHQFREMMIDVQKELIKPNKEVTFTYKNRLKMETKEDTTIVTMANNTIKHMIEYTNDYQKIKIILNESIGQRLAEFEYVLSGMMFFEMALDQGYLPIHASCIHYQGHTFLLSGPSKSGKSTQTNHFLDVYPKAIIINEDKPLIYLKDEQIYTIGSPWSGKHVINENQSKRLNDIFFIHQSKELKITQLSRANTIKQIFRNIHRPGEEVLIDQMLDIMTPLIDQVNIYQFDCIDSPDSSTYLMHFLEGNHEN